MNTIREMKKTDHEEIIKLTEILSEWFDEDARLRAIPADLLHQYGFIAESDDKIVGFITLFFAEGRLNIGWLAVLPEFHNQGIGKKLLKKAEDFGRKNNVTEISTYTLGDTVDYPPYEKTRAFYFKNGFQIYQRNKTDNPNCPEEIKIKKTILI